MSVTCGLGWAPPVLGGPHSLGAKPGVTFTPFSHWLSVASIILVLHIVIWRELSIRLPTAPPKIISRIEVELRTVDRPAQQALPLAQPPANMTPSPRSEEQLPIARLPPRRPIENSLPQSMTPPTAQADTPLIAAPAPAPVESASTPVTPSSAPNQEVIAPQNAAYLHNPKPNYPLAARRAGYEGKVIVKALIQTDGSAERVEVKKSSGYELLDRAALEAVKTWRFVPAKRGKEPIVEWVDIPWIFKLEEE